MRYSSQPPPRGRPTAPAEETDEARGQIERDQVDIERGVPAEHFESIERIEPSDPDPTAFEE